MRALLGSSRPGASSMPRAGVSSTHRAGASSTLRPGSSMTIEYSHSNAFDPKGFRFGEPTTVVKLNSAAMNRLNEFVHSYTRRTPMPPVNAVSIVNAVRNARGRNRYREVNREEINAREEWREANVEAEEACKRKNAMRRRVMSLKRQREEDRIKRMIRQIKELRADNKDKDETIKFLRRELKHRQSACNELWKVKSNLEKASRAFDCSTNVE